MKVSKRIITAMGPDVASEVASVGVDHGAHIELTREDWIRIGAQHRMRGATVIPEGIGDLVAKFATPIARVLGLSCIDPATNQLRPDSGCAKRKAALNRLTQ